VVAARHGDREGVAGEPGGLEGAEAGGKADDVADLEGAVPGDLVDQRPDEGVGAHRVGEALGEGRLDQGLQEGVLAADAAEVGQRVAAPDAVLEVGEVAAARQGEGAVAVETDAAGLGDVEAGQLVPGGIGEADVDAVQGVDDRPEAVEVDQDVVVDGDAEVLLDGLDQLAGTAAEGRVDAVLRAAAGDGDD
jgi:hypothetical protein